jgi:hypothetical protein
VRAPADIKYLNSMEVGRHLGRVLGILSDKSAKELSDGFKSWCDIPHMHSHTLPNAPQ